MNMERIDEPEINRQIILTWLQKFDLMNDEERRAAIQVVKLLSNPIFVSNA